MTVFSPIAIFFYEKCQNVMPFKFLRVKKVEILSCKKNWVFFVNFEKARKFEITGSHNFEFLQIYNVKYFRISLKL